MERKKSNLFYCVDSYCLGNWLCFLAQDTYISTVVITPPQLGQLADYPVIVEAVAPSKHNNINNAIFANAVSRLSAKALTLRPENSLVIRPLD